MCRLLVHRELNKNKYILKHSTCVCQHLVFYPNNGILTQRSDQPRRVDKKILLRNGMEEDLESVNWEPSSLRASEYLHRHHTSDFPVEKV